MTVTVVRRVIVFALLFTLITIAAIGLSGLLERVLAGDSVLVDGAAGLARALAFTLVAAPLAAALWWWERRRLAEPAERGSLVWSLYLAAMSVTALVVTVNTVCTVVASGIEGQWRPGEAAAAVIWAPVWLWHRRLPRGAAIAPTRLPLLGAQLSSLYGLAVAASGALAALAALVSAAVARLSPVLIDSQSWHVAVLQGVVWALVGVLVWWWHWYRAGARKARGGFAQVLLVVIVALSAAAALFGIGAMLYAVLRLLASGAPVAEALGSLDRATGAALVGAIVCGIHARLLPGYALSVGRAARFAVTGVALVGAASGFGVVVNALLPALGDTLVRDDPRALLLGGISALVVGAPTWWIVWRSAHASTPERSADIARRVYLVVVFGAGAVVALVTLLLIGYRLFEAILDTGASGGLIERIRAPFGLLSATVLVFAYHFTIWRRDRAVAVTPAGRHRVEQVVLVAGGDIDAIATRIRRDAGARVTAWRSADGGTAPDEAELSAAIAQLHELAVNRVLMVADRAEVRVIPLAG